MEKIRTEEERKWIDANELPIDEAIDRLKILGKIVGNFYSDAIYVAIKALRKQKNEFN